MTAYRTCPQCGTTFEPRRGGVPQRYCTNACKKTAAGRPAVPLTPRVCADCGVSFIPTSGTQKYCTQHFKQSNRFYVKKERKTVDERYWSYVTRLGPNECWPWTGATLDTGYGIFGYGVGAADKRQTTAHRYGLSLKLGKPLTELAPHTLHSCDNRICQNPTHLSEGTAAENVADAQAKGRLVGNFHYGEDRASHKLTEDDVRAIRTRWANGERSSRKLAAEFNVTHAAIRLLIRRITWRHVV